MPVGTIAMYHQTRGYGFIKPDAGGRDVYFNVGILGRAGIETISPGDRVEFDAKMDERQRSQFCYRIKKLDLPKAA